MLSIAIWTMGAAFEAAVVEPPAKILFAQIEYIGFVNVPPLLFLFNLMYVDMVRGFRSVFLLFWILPLITLILAWTNALHGLIWSSYSAGSQTSNILIYHHGLGYWIFLAYLYLLAIIGIIVLIREYILSARTFKSQIATVLIASLFPCLAGFFYLSGLEPIPGLDISPISCAVAGICLAWGIFRLQILNPAPAARQVLHDNLSDGIIILDTHNCIVEINPSARLYLNAPDQIYEGVAFEYFLSFPINLSSLSGGAPIEIALPNNANSDNLPTRYIELQTSRLYRRPEKPVGTLLILRDITRRKVTELKLQETNHKLLDQLNETRHLKDQLKELANRDFLTGMHNRRYLDENFARELARAVHHQQPVSLLLIDVDNFKKINDEHGHIAGDLILQKLSELIKMRTRREDIACRFGGDEFLVILPGVDSASTLKRSEALRQEFQDIRIPYQDNVLSTTVSIGIAVYPLHGETPDQLLRAVDLALYQSKTLGRNRLSMIQPDTQPLPQFRIF